MKTNIAVLVLLGAAQVQAATVHLSARSLAQSGVVLDAELGTEVLGENFLNAEAKAQASLIMSTE